MSHVSCLMSQLGERAAGVIHEKCTEIQPSFRGVQPLQGGKDADGLSSPQFLMIPPWRSRAPQTFALPAAC